MDCVYFWLFKSEYQFSLLVCYSISRASEHKSMIRSDRTAYAVPGILTWFLVFLPRRVMNLFCCFSDWYYFLNVCITFVLLDSLSITIISDLAPFQVIRSVSQWSAGTSQVEESIHSAYCSLIEKAEHFVYIEVHITLFYKIILPERKRNTKGGQEVHQKISLEVPFSDYYYHSFN